MSEHVSHVVRAEIVLDPRADPAAVGAAVTVALCGHWEHEGPCRWPHHSAIDASEVPARFRTVVVAPVAEVNDVHDRIVSALCTADEWTVSTVTADVPRDDECELAARLAPTEPEAGSAQR